MAMKRLSRLAWPVSIVVLLIAAAAFGVCLYLGEQRTTRLRFEEQGHQLFREAQFDSAIARYEAAEEYGTLSENAESMLKMARVLVDDSDLALEFFEFADSIAPKVVDTLGRPK